MTNLRSGSFFAGALVILEIVYLAACSPALPIPQESDLQAVEAAKLGVMLDSLRQGRALYVQRCGICHLLKYPQDYTAGQWTHSVDEMKGRAHLTSTDQQRILTYLRFYARKDTAAVLH